jgi:MFS family permease
MPDKQTSSPWTPLRDPLFRALWLAAVVSNIGTWMQNIAAAWLMTSLTQSALLISLVQAATSLPIFLLSLPAGAIADVVDRRKLLILSQVWMLVVAGLLGGLTVAGLTTPAVLLGLTFLLGLGGAMTVPAWQAAIPELVSREEIPSAVVLNSISFNLALAVGPALGGMVVAAAGPGAAFLVNAASFLGVAAVLYYWKRRPRESELPAERVLGAIRAGNRYVRHAPALHAVLVRGGVFILCGSAMWALLPLLARQVLGLSPAHYGILLGCFGGGSVAGAVLLPRLRHRVTSQQQVAGATLLFAAVAVGLGSIKMFPLLCLVLFCGGLAWIALMSILMVAAQMVVPAWVKARALAVFMLVFQGGMAAGSAVWGAVAARVGVPQAFYWAAAGLVVGMLAMVKYRLGGSEDLDLAPSLHWGTPDTVQEPEAEHGPVLVTVEYHIQATDAEAFAEAMRGVRRIRLRDGAMRWGLFQDTSEPTRYLETFVVTSWLEHLRQHERVTMSDQQVEEGALAYHTGQSPPVVSHLISAYASSEPQPRMLSMFHGVLSAFPSSPGEINKS